MHMHINICTCKTIYIHMYMYIYIYIYMYIYIYVYMYIYIVYIYIYVYILRLIQWLNYFSPHMKERKKRIYCGRAIRTDPAFLDCLTSTIDHPYACSNSRPGGASGVAVIKNKTQETNISRSAHLRRCDLIFPRNLKMQFRNPRLNFWLLFVCLFVCWDKRRWR